MEKYILRKNILRALRRKPAWYIYNTELNTMVWSNFGGKNLAYHKTEWGAARGADVLRKLESKGI